MTFITTSTGKPYNIEITGAQRDSQEGKPRYDLVGNWGLKRLAELYARGAIKYDERNWEKGQSTSRTWASLKRHVEFYAIADLLGMDAEDHLAAICFNAFSLMHVEEEVKAGRMPAELLDMPHQLRAKKEVVPLEEKLGVLNGMIVDYLDKQLPKAFTSRAIHTATLPTLSDNEFNSRLIYLVNEGAILAVPMNNEPGADWLYLSARDPIPQNKRAWLQVEESQDYCKCAVGCSCEGVNDVDVSDSGSWWPDTDYGDSSEDYRYE